MQTIIDIARNDLRIMFKDRSVWINLVFVPLVISYVIGYALGANGGGVPTAARLIVDVIDQDGGALSQQFFADIGAANPNILLCPMDDAEGDPCQLGGKPLDDARAQQRLQEQTSLALIEIPAGFTADVSAGQNASIVYRSNENASAPSYILQAVQAAAQKLGGALTAARVGGEVAKQLDLNDPAITNAIREKASALWSSDPVRIETVVGQQTESGSSEPYGFKQSMTGIGTMYALFIVIPGAAALILERKNWTLQRMATLPISRAQILGGKLLARFLTGMLEYGIILGFGLVLGVRYGNDPLAIVLLAAAFTLAVTALTLALTSLMRNESQARGIGLFLTLTLTPLGGAWWPLDIVPEFMRTVGHISPVAWVMDGFTSVVFNGGSLGTVLVPLAVLLGMAVVFFAIGVSRFKFTD
jgi:ABC-2 type transport system permease protein